MSQSRSLLIFVFFASFCSIPEPANHDRRSQALVEIRAHQCSRIGSKNRTLIFANQHSQVEQKLPVVISVGEVHTILKLIEKPSMRCYFSVVYALGLRLNEGLHLQVSDIDSKRMLVHVYRGKGAAMEAATKFCFTPVSPEGNTSLPAV